MKSYLSRPIAVVSFATLTLLVSPGAHGASVVRSVGGDSVAATIAPARDQFRVDVGGGTTAGANGSFGGQRREINWDGVPATSSAPNLLAANFFNSTSPRGVLFSTPGTGFEVSSATTDARAFNLYGSIPATCYGPEAQNIHGIDESVSIESTLRVAQVLALFMARWCGVEKTR